MPSLQVQVPFPDNSMPGTHFQESGGRIINAYVEPLGPAAPSPIIYRRAPGLRNFGTTTRTGFRGGIEIDGTLFAAFNNRLVGFNAAGGASADIGILTGTAKGFFARNMKAPIPDKVFCDADGNYAAFELPNAVTMNYDTDLPAPNSVCSMDGFFVFTIADGRVFASDINSINISPLSFATAESKSDGLTRAVPWAGQLYLFGPFTTEVWSNVGAFPFPFQRSLVIPRGLAGPFCVSGFEDNFSQALCWVADDNSVRQLSGYTANKISPPDLDGLIEAVTNKRELEMSCFTSRGHSFIMLSSLTWSWVFDLNFNKWSERKSYLKERSRITGGVFAFGKWLCGDTMSGNVQEITNLVHTEIDQPFRWRLESGAVENFPVGARVGRVDFEFVTGVGNALGSDPIETDPTVEISWSDDGGQTYYAPIPRKLGRQALTRQLVSLIACTGRSSWNARRWRLDIADPVHVGFMAAYQNISPRVSDLGG
jgi:hypothetical protein